MKTRKKGKWKEWWEGGETNEWGRRGGSGEREEEKERVQGKCGSVTIWRESEIRDIKNKDGWLVIGCKLKEEGK